MKHEWRQPKLALRKGAPVFWCTKCGVFSPVPRIEECQAPANFWMYEPNKPNAAPMRADEVIRRLYASLPEKEKEGACLDE